MKTDRLTEQQSRVRWLAWVPVAAIALVASPGLIGEVRAQDGLLDLKFGRPGVFTPVGPKGSVVNFMRALPDGRILAIGQATEDGDDTHAALARYNADGSLDVTFGHDGVVKTHFGGSTESAEWFDVQADGKIVVLGNTLRGATNGTHHQALARYHADGSLDASFGKGGRVATNIPNADLFGAAVRVQPDGRLLVVGIAVTSYVPTSDGREFTVARYNADGSPDATFGQGGLKRWFPHGSYISPSGDSIAIQADGKIVAATFGAENPATGAGVRLRVMRLNADGSPDASFNHGTMTNVAMLDSMVVLSSLAIQPDGKILVAAMAPPAAPGGDPQPDRADVRVTRLNADGTLDEPFAHEHGFLTVDVAFAGQNRATALAVQADGKILVALAVNSLETPQPVAALLRYKPDGLVDFTFGNGGTVVASYTDPSRQPYASTPFAIALQADGKILLGGTSVQPGATSGATSGFSLLRFENRSAAPVEGVAAGKARGAGKTRK